MSLMHEPISEIAYVFVTGIATIDRVQVWFK